MDLNIRYLKPHFTIENSFENPNVKIVVLTFEVHETSLFLLRNVAGPLAGRSVTRDSRTRHFLTIANNTTEKPPYFLSVLRFNAF